MNVTPIDRRSFANLRERVAAEVRSELGRQGISVNAAAKALGWTQPYLQRRVSGTTAFDVDDLERIAIWLAIPVQRLLGQPAEPGPPLQARTGTDTGARTDWYLPRSRTARHRDAKVIAFPGSYQPVSITG